jgi:hypothetical protein
LAENHRNKARDLTIQAFGGFGDEELHEGARALYHFHPPDRNPATTHAFYDTTRRYAKRKK